MAIDNVRIEKLVREFLQAQSLKILPQAPFGDAVGQFVDKDDRHAVEMFVNQSLAGQQKHLFELDEEEEDLDGIMEVYRARLEEMFLDGTLKRATKKGKLKPRPDHWDSDLDGEWEDQPGAYEIGDGEEEEEEEDATPAPASRRGKINQSDNEESVAAATSRKVPIKKAPPKKPIVKAASKKAPVKATTARGRKKAVEISDDEDDDVMMLDEEPANPQPRRAAATRTTGRQTQLNFSQSLAKSQPKELSDDEISDEDDAFEPMPASTRRR